MNPKELHLKRIERAWQQCKDWILEFDGSPTQVYLSNVVIDSLQQAFQTIAAQAQNFRLSLIASDVDAASNFIDLEQLPLALVKLQKREIGGLNINYATAIADFSLDLHFVLHTLGSRKVDLEIVWWTDQVFDEESNAHQRFSELLAYFLSLLDIFGAAHLYIGPETLEKPGPGSLTWVEI